MAIRSIGLLPEIFKTDTNQKFVNATIEQLTSDPALKKVNGYIGRRFTPLYNNADNYIGEATRNRLNYQLEPAVAVDIDDQTGFISHYTDLLDKIKFYGGTTNNQSRLFSNEFYSYNSQIDYDKFVNFSQYYWLPAGVASVNVLGTEIPVQQDFIVTQKTSVGSVATGFGYYNFSNLIGQDNPIITLARGGTYTFEVDQIEDLFWIQTQPGIIGQQDDQLNFSTREVWGVENNGSNSATITFNVPTTDAQSFYIDMSNTYNVNLVAEGITYSDLQGIELEEFNAIFGGIDNNEFIDGKYIIFADNDIDDHVWTYDTNVVPDSERRGIWLVSLVGSTIMLSYVQDIPNNTKVSILEGTVYNAREWYKNASGVLEVVPYITVLQDTLYYQSSSDPLMTGMIKLVDNDEGYIIDVDKEIIGQPGYVSPNGVTFTNGLKILFADDVIPVTYAGNEYYIEGVGDAIVITNVENFVTPETYINNTLEPYDTEMYDTTGFEGSTNAPVDPDYATINRAAIDGNAWSRSNRWFHIDVINAAAEYGNYQANIDQSRRAQRPIIEFNAGLQLFNHGIVAKNPIDVADVVETDIFSNIEGHLTPYYVDGVELTEGMRVIFAAELNLEISSHVYMVNIIDPDSNGTDQIHLVPDGDVPLVDMDGILITDGQINKGKMFHYENNKWIQSLSKTKQYQPPLFNVFDLSGISLSDTGLYPASTFTGTNIFSYAIGTGLVDSVLGFPLKYRNFDNVGDIIFDNNFDSDEFDFTIDREYIIQKVNTGFLHETIDIANFVIKNVWDTIEEESHQYQLTSYLYNTTRYYQIDILPEAEKSISYYNVYVNSKLLDRSQFTFETIDRINYVVLDDTISLNEDSKIDIMIYSNESSLYGWFQVPTNLENNAQNNSFADLTLGQIRNHVGTVFNRSLNLIGVFPGRCNLRDAQLAMKAGGNILQHSASIPYSSLFLLDEKANFINSVIYAQTEYAKFKNRFLDLAVKLTFTDVDNLSQPDAIVKITDQIIEYINQVKTTEFPWYASDMVPYGNDNTSTDTQVFSLVDRDYELSYIHNDTILSNKAVLVYVNGIQILNDVDYTIYTDQPYITISDQYNLQIDDVVRIVEYNNTDGCWIPETPTKLGLYPKWNPIQFIDTTYITPREVIQGHDGSITPIFGDHRDALLLELESRIYNNIKTSYDEQRFNIYDLIPGKFREGEYSKTEIHTQLSHMFYLFAGENKLNYRDNDNFDPTNGFTYNYRKFVSVVDGEQMSGSWRAVYHYHYDTDRPHTHPWEMLGFSIEPSWWQARYGVAPYTSGNLVLWDDLEIGKIYAGDRAGIDPAFGRSGLKNIIPVDQFGTLKSPDKFLVTGMVVRYANEKYIIGEEGVVETAWRRSSYFPYAMQALMAISKPAKYFGLYADTQKYRFNADIQQYLNSETSQRLTQYDIMLNGETNDNTITRSASYLNWIVDYVKSDGISPTNYIGFMLDNFVIKLAYKVAGFTDKKFLKILAEQSSPSSSNSSILIPDENFDVILNKSAPLYRFSYSAVIIQKTSIGYKVDGYDVSRPYFTILPSIINSNTRIIELLTDRIEVYNDFIKTQTAIPYGIEFTTKTELVDFLVSYGRWLERQGIIFDNYDEQSGEIRNWIMSSKEFLYWTQQGWGVDSAIVVSPLGDTLNLRTPGVIVNEITDSSPAKLLDQNFRPIKQLNFIAKRVDNDFTLTLRDEQTVGFVELSLVQYEHVLVFDNVTVFNDIIYQPELGNRQARLKMVGLITDNWNGNVTPGGFIYNENNVKEWQTGHDYEKGDIVQYKSNYYVANIKLVAAVEFDYAVWKSIEYDQIKLGLLPNYTSKAVAPEAYYDIDNVNLESQTDLFGKGLIGYRNRSYFNDLGMDDTSQVKFYQGFIEEKGTKHALEALTRAQFDQYSSDIEVFEEWALRVGGYGATDSTRFIETRLNENDHISNSSFLVFNNVGDTETYGAVNIYPDDLHNGSLNYNKAIFLNDAEPKGLDYTIKTAGFPKPAQVDYMLYEDDDFVTMTQYIYTAGVGESIWIAKDTDNDWDVFRISETDLTVVSVDTSDSPQIEFTTNKYNDFVVSDRVLIRGMATLIDGWYRIKKIIDLNTFMVENINSLVTEVDGDLITFDDSSVLVGQLYKLETLRFTYAKDIAAANLDIVVWRDGEFFYIDQIDNKNNWGVMEKSSPWDFLYRGTDQQVTIEAKYGTTVETSENGMFIYVGSPDLRDGELNLRIKSETGLTIPIESFLPITPTTNGYGTSIAVASGSSFIVGAPTSDSITGSNAGQAYIYMRGTRGSTAYELAQILTVPGVANDTLFGDTMVLSDDEQWLYICATTLNTARAYSLKVDSDPQRYTEITSDATVGLSFTMPFTLNSYEQLRIIDNFGNFYVLAIDYTLSGNVVTFIEALPIPGNAPIELVFEKLSEYFMYAGDIDLPKVLDGTKYAISTTSDGSEIVVGIPGTYNTDEPESICTALPVYAGELVNPNYDFFVILDVTKDSSGNIIMIGGIMYLVGDFTIIYNDIIVKYNNNLELVWFKVLNIGSANYEKITTDTNDNIIVTTESEANSVLLKYDSDGTLSWQKEIESSDRQVINDIGTDASNNKYLLYYIKDGAFSDRDASVYDTAIMKVDAADNEVWVKRIYDIDTIIYQNSNVTPYDIYVMPNGDFYVSGLQKQSGPSPNVRTFVIKMNTNGVLIWSKLIDNYSYYNPLSVDSVGNVYVIGKRDFVIYPNLDLSLYKIGSDGSGIWELTFEGVTSGYDTVSTILFDSDDNILVVDKDTTVTKVSPNGEVLWSIVGATTISPSCAVMVDGCNLFFVDNNSGEHARIPINEPPIGQTCGSFEMTLITDSIFTLYDSVPFVAWLPMAYDDILYTYLDSTYDEISMELINTPGCFVEEPEEPIVYDKFTAPGEVIVYDRTIESFITDGIQDSYEVAPGFNADIIKIIIDDELLTTDQYTTNSSAGTVTLGFVPTTSKIVRIETSHFNMIEHLYPDPDSIHDNDNFGYDVDLCVTNCSIAVGMPNFDESVIQQNSGAVYQYVNQSRQFGTTLGTIQTPTVTDGDSIRIDNIPIVFNGITGLSGVVDAINDALIPGVSAIIEDDKLRINSNSQVTFAKLTIAPGANPISTAFHDLGLVAYPRTAEVLSPIARADERFGESVIISRDGISLIVGSSIGASYLTTTFDNNTTVFDSDSTLFGEREVESGAVSVFEYIPAINETINNIGNFLFTQHLTGNSINRYDRFGASLAVSRDSIIVGSPNDDILDVNNAGSIYTFYNSTGTHGWNTIITQEPRIDIDAINRILLYNEKTKEIIQPLDYIDPVKGKIIGQAAQEIDLMTSNDPAAYNVGVSLIDSTTNSLAWSSKHIGKVWWDLSTVRYLDYEQSTVEYKVLNWGKLFPGSSVDVYEWVESTVLPSEYSASGYDGVPKDIDDSLYTELGFTDPESGVPMSLYYFWVKGKTTVDVTTSEFRTMPISRVTDYILNPKGQGIAYAEILDQSSIGLVNISDKLIANDIVLHIDYDVQKNHDVIHSEYILLQEGGESIFPTSIINKFIDSLSGIDKFEYNVPDPDLLAGQKYGIEIRPRQALVVNRNDALMLAMETANSILINNRILDSRSMPSMYVEDEPPTAESGEWNESIDVIEDFPLLDTDSYPIGYKVLVLSDSSVENFWTIYEQMTDGVWKVIKVQSFDTTRYWETVDWYADGYNANTEIDVKIDSKLNLYSITANLGDIIKINDNGNGHWEIYKVEDTGFNIIGIQDATIQILDTLYDPNMGAGFDSIGFDSSRYDQSPQSEMRHILEALFYEILIGDLLLEQNRLFFILVRYALSEQRSIDWIFKTSFISVNHAFSKLEEAPVYKQDNQTYLQEYINEVKPYRTKVREYLLSYERTDVWTGDVTDFDIPAYYDTSLNRFRSPNGEQLNDEVMLSTIPEYNQWFNHHGYSIDSIGITESGSGYLQPPTITISGGGGTGATAYTKINEDGGVSTIVMVNNGSGYISMPLVEIAPSSGITAIGYPYLKNGTIRKLNTTIKFDRVTYETTLKDWHPETIYYEGEIVLYNDNPFKIIQDFTSDENGSFEFEYMELVTASEFDNANDRTWAYYHPASGMIGRDLGQLYKGIEYPGVIVTGITGDDVSIDMELDGGNLDTNFDGIQPGQMEVDGGAFVDVYSSHSPEELIPGSIFETIDMQVFTAPEGSTVPEIGYRMFQDMSGSISYYRIANSGTTELAQPLLINDTLIYVTDASVLTVPIPNNTMPGVVMIGGERIIYYGIGPTNENHPDFPDVPANALYQIWRGTKGTGAPAEHEAGLRVVDMSDYQEISTISNERVDTLLPPWKVWTITVATHDELLELPVDEYRVGATALVRIPQSVYIMANVTEEGEDPERYEWELVKVIYDEIWYNQGVSTASDGQGLLAANTQEVMFLKKEPPFDPSTL